MKLPETLEFFEWYGENMERVNRIYHERKAAGINIDPDTLIVSMFQAELQFSK